MGNGGMKRIAELERLAQIYVKADRPFPWNWRAGDYIALGDDANWIMAASPKAIMGLVSDLRAALDRNLMLQRDYSIARERYQVAESALTAARAALQRYGLHLDECNSHWSGKPCDCGLDKALSTPGDAPNGGVNG